MCLVLLKLLHKGLSANVADVLDEEGGEHSNRQALVLA